MLTEISCDSFRENGESRGVIRLRRGLNIVLGDEHGANSIGKTTFLLAIDFAFGGTSYAKSTDILENVGPHEIKFSHVIASEPYYFSRDPADLNAIWVCDQNYCHRAQISESEFKNWLASAYGIDSLGSSFRELVGGFLRIYGKNNYNELRPLAAHQNDTASNGIERILRLTDNYSQVEALDRACKTTKKQLDALLIAAKANLAVCADNKTQYKKNILTIERLDSALAELQHCFEHGFSKEAEVDVTRNVRLMNELAALQRERRHAQAQFDLIEIDSSIGKSQLQKDFDSLLTYFPSANIAELKKVEEFHRNLNVALTKERNEMKASLQTKIDALQQSIRILTDKLDAHNDISSTNAAALIEFAELYTQQQALLKANETFEKKEELGQEFRHLKAQRNVFLDAALIEVAATINQELLDANKYVCNDTRYEPHFSLKHNNYELVVPNDTGTGSRARAMVLFDIALLKHSVLPVAIHDTVFLKQISDEYMMKICDLYESCGKQVFIALDKASSYSEGVVSNKLTDYAVLSLSEGHELFGHAWARKP